MIGRLFNVWPPAGPVCAVSVSWLFGKEMAIEYSKTLLKTLKGQFKNAVIVYSCFSMLCVLTICPLLKEKYIGKQKENFDRSFS